jgi:gliding motility-associated-like protein
MNAISITTMKILFKILILFLPHLLIITPLHAQNVLGSINQGDSLLVPCNPGCAGLSVNYAKVKKTNTYTVNTVAYAPSAIAGTTVSFAADDYYSTAIPIGFTFCFFGNSYQQLYISDNGIITFNTFYSGMPCTFGTQTSLPSSNSAMADNAIYGPFIDAKLSLGGTITYSTIGTAPFRKFIVKYSNIPFFNNNCTGTLTNTYQIELAETYNTIDCYIANKNVCNNVSSNWLNYATLGIQNIGASIAITAPNKNASVWSATNEAYQFTPNGTSGATVAWRLNSATSASISSADSITPCLSGSVTNAWYYVTVSYSCPAITIVDSIKLKSLKPKIDSIVLTHPTCSGINNGCVTIYATSPTPPLTYAVGVPQVYGSSNTICGLGAGNQNVYVKDNAGCTAQAFALLVPLTQLTITTTAIVPDSCPMNSGLISIAVTGGTPNYTYQWQGGGTDSFISNLVGNQSYIVTVTDANGCSTFKQIYLLRKGVPIITDSVIKTTCTNSNGGIYLKVTVPATTGLPSYSWSNNIGNIPNNVPVAAGLYSVTVTATNGCTNSKLIVVADTLTPVIQVDSFTTKCGLSNGGFTVGITGGLPPFTITANGVPYTNNSPTLAAGTYTVSVTGANGCVRTKVKIVPSSIPIIVNVTKGLPHCDSANGLLSVTTTNAVSPIKYLWANGDTTNSLSNLAPGIYTITVTDNIGCTTVQGINLPDAGVPHLQIVSYQPPSCYGDSNGSVTLSGFSGIGPYKYSTDSINFSAIAVLNNISGGSYKIFIKDAVSCIRDTIVTFVQPNQIILDYNITDSLKCFYDVLDKLVVKASGGTGKLNVYYNAALIADTIIASIPAGQQIISVVDSAGCTDSFLLEVPSPSEPLKINKSIENSPCFTTNNGNLSVNFTGGWGAYNYTWANGVFTGLTASGVAPGVYSLTVTDLLGCSVTDSIAITQLLCCRVDVPNAFTPNGDLDNNILKPIPLSEVNEIEFYIFDRWGNLVFETKDLSNGWDGANHEMATYFYLLKYNCVFDKKRIVQKGDILFLR